MKETKPFDITERQVAEAYQRVKANKGGAGVDKQSIEQFDRKLDNNLYKLWNRMASGSYFPPPVKAVPIAKKSGGERILGVPTIADRTAQAVVTGVLVPILEPVFHEDSYGYRPGKSAHQAIEVTQVRCRKIDWVLEYDIRGLFDNIDHALLLKALRRHTQEKWILLYVERWLTAPMQEQDGTLTPRERGCPQGGPLSPVLSNLFLHYALDSWLARDFAAIPFCRYADDGILHCRSEKQARFMLRKITQRLKDCGLEIHPQKTRIVYCKDGKRTGTHDTIQFDFLGYTFKPRDSRTRNGKVFLNFGAALSRAAAKAMRQEIRSWRIQLKSDLSLFDLAHKYGPVIQGWIHYYCRCRPSAFQIIADHFNAVLVRWAMRKYKRLRQGRMRAYGWLRKFALQNPRLFPHWGKAEKFVVGSLGAR